MSGRLRYADAVKLLGGQTPEVKALDNLLGGALAVATGGGSEFAMGLFDAKTEVIRLGHVLTDKLHEKLGGFGRFDRTNRLRAAHGVIVVTSFFEAVGEIVRAADLPDPEITRDEQVTLATQTPAGDWLPRLLSTAALPEPSPERTPAELGETVEIWAYEAGHRLLGFLGGLHAWEKATDDRRRRAQALIEHRLPVLTRRRYDENARRLAAEIPEFALWIGETAAEARHRELGRSLAGLEAFFARTTQGSNPERHRTDLALAYRADLDEPVAEGDAGAITFPALADLYIDPDFLVKPAGPADRVADEDWWNVERRGDLADFLAGHLVTAAATEAPLLLLGQPGAGKSALTRVLAARLPAADFLVVRVELREVDAGATVLDQIEAALRATIGRTVTWPDLVAAADGALPVILLDGFDELLQATGAHQSDYLAKVAAFQRREAKLGRPAAIVVTSRVAVADRAALPGETLVVRLAGFSPEQVGRWLSVWNETNAEYGRPPLTHAAVARYPHLVEQPLLLLMLALYDAEEPLRPDVDLELADLYERLMVRFAEREVRRWHPGAPPSAVADLVEDELLRLSVVAMAMFQRSRLWVTDREVDADLAALGIAAARSALEVTPAQEVVGRFFFLQRAQAIADGTTRQAYEFLHATFGEYLVARLVVREIRDGGMLRSLIGYQPLFARDTVPRFLHTMLYGKWYLRDRLLSLLRAAMTDPSPPDLAYRPVERRVDHWMALWSLNLTLLVMACGRVLRASEIFPDHFDPAGQLHGASGQWAAVMERSVWGGFLDVLTVRRTWDGTRQDVELVFDGTVPTERVDPWWTHGRDDDRSVFTPGTVVTGFTTAENAAKSLHLGGGIGADMMRHALEPLTSRAPQALTNFMVDEDGMAMTSVLHDLLDLLVASAARSSDLVFRYDRTLSTLSAVSGDDFRVIANLLLSRMTADAGLFDSPTMTGWLRRIVEDPSYTPHLAPWVLESVAALESPPPEVRDLIVAALGEDHTVFESWSAGQRARVRDVLQRLSHLMSEDDFGIVMTALLERQ